MGNSIELHPSRGTKLYRNSKNPLIINVSAKDVVDIIEILLIKGELIEIQKLDSENRTIKILPNQEYLLVNLSSVPIFFEYDQNPDTHEQLFDPYRYETNPFDVIDPETFKKTHSIPEGYSDILAKWYSIKFTYPDKNLIHIRPHLGISIQSHTKRTEDWKIIQGHPIIIANSKVHYTVNPGDEFQTDSGKIHAIFNNTDDWVVIEESYTGTFEEEDIVRVFNPNHYQ
jgi:mannose-6-phosphate isomerase-like protein (cupin superfamily)